MPVTILGPIDSAVYTGAAAARSGIETQVIAWLTVDQAAAALPLKDYPVDLHLIEQSDDNFLLTTKQLNQAMQHALEHGEAVVFSTGAWSVTASDTITWLADTLGLKLIAALEADELESPLIRYVSSLAIGADGLNRAYQTGDSDLSIARRVAESGPSEVIVIHQPGASFVYAADSNEGYDTPNVPPAGPDRIGLAETFLGAYAARHQLSDSIFESGRYASMAASLKSAYPGPLHETAEEIERRLQAQPLTE